jgi:hypothetical protein
MINITFMLQKISSRFYVSETKLPLDLDYFTRFEGHNPTNDPGLGLFQRTY